MSQTTIFERATISLTPSAENSKATAHRMNCKKAEHLLARASQIDVDRVFSRVVNGRKRWFELMLNGCINEL
jgi:hypothetical protein